MPFFITDATKKNKATGVRVIDAHTKDVTEYFAKIIFVNAAALNSNLILLNLRWEFRENAPECKYNNK